MLNGKKIKAKRVIQNENSKIRCREIFETKVEEKYDEISESILSGIDGKEKMKELRKFLTTPFRISLDGIVCSIDPTDGISAVQELALESIKGVMKLKGSNKRRGEKRKRRMFVNTKQGASTFDLAIQRDSITRRVNAENNAKNDKADAKTKKEAQKQLDAMDEIRSARVENDDDRETRWWDSTDASPILRKEDLKILTKIFCVDVTRRDGKSNNDPTKDDYEHFLLIRDLNMGDIERKLNELEDIVYGEEDEDGVNEEDVLGPGDEFVESQVD